MTFPILCSDPLHAQRSAEPDWADTLGLSSQPVSGLLCGACARHQRLEAAALADNTQSIRSKAASALAALESADANWPTLTAAQKDTATRLAVRVAAKLTRLVLGLLDAS